MVSNSVAAVAGVLFVVSMLTWSLARPVADAGTGPAAGALGDVADAAAVTGLLSFLTLLAWAAL